MKTDNLLAGAIAVELGLVQPDQLDECVRLQDASFDPRPIGTLFLEKGLLTPHQLDQLLAEQKRRMEQFSDSRLFGQIVLSRRFITASRLGECIREQLRVAEERSRPLLGEVMLKKGYISLDQFQDAITVQGKALFHCVKCDRYYAHPSTIAIADAVCGTCRDLLRIVEDVGEMRRWSRGDSTRSAKLPFARLGKFEILSEIARGSMGIVFKAFDQSLDRKVALKVLKEGDADATFIRRLHREASIAAKLHHPNIVTIHEVGETDGLHYLCMDYVPGWHLIDFVRLHRLGLKPAVRIVETVARAIHYAHACGVVHRDLKPSNILVKKDGTPYVTDFGLAKTLDTSFSLTKEGTALGTPYYMPPEQVLGQLDRINARSDVYSLGVILYELLTGDPPFTGSTAMEIYQRILNQDPLRPSEVHGEIDPELEAVCLQAMEKDPALRYASALDFAEDLRCFLAGEPVRASKITRSRILRKTLRRHGWRILTAAATVLAAVVVWRAAVVVDSRGKVQDLLASADELFRRGEWLPARSKYQGILDLDTGHGAALRKIGECDGRLEEERHRREEEAIRRREEEKERQRSEARPHFDTGFQKMNEANLLMHQPDVTLRQIDARFREAVEAFTRALERDPEFTEAHHLRGRCHYDLWELEEACSDLSKAIELTGGHSAAHLLRGQIYFLQAINLNSTLFTPGERGAARILFRTDPSETPRIRELMSRAAADFQTVVESQDREEDRLFVVALAALAEGNTYDAVVYFTRLLSLNPLHAEACFGCSLAHLIRGEYDVALERIERAMQLKPNYYPAHSIVGLMKFGRGDEEEALADFRRAAEMRPLASPHRNIAVLLLLKGDHAGALEAASRACQLSPRDAELRFLRGKILYELDRIEESLREVEAILEMDLPLPEAYKLGGFCYLRREKTDLAVEYFERALALAPEDDELLSNFALLRHDLGEREEAMRLVERALAINPGNSHAYNVRGLLRTENGTKPAEGLEDFHRAIETDPGHGKAYMNLGWVLAMLGRHEEALEILEQGKKMDPSKTKEAEAKIAHIRRLMREKKP